MLIHTSRHNPISCQTRDKSQRWGGGAIIRVTCQKLHTPHCIAALSPDYCTSLYIIGRRGESVVAGLFWSTGRIQKSNAITTRYGLLTAKLT